MMTKTISTLPIAAALMNIAHNKFDDGGHGHSKTFSADTGSIGGGTTTKVDGDTTICDNFAKAGIKNVDNKDRVRVPGTASSA